MDSSQFITRLQDIAKFVIPQGGEAWLFGSRARGDARKDSDWDILILINKPTVNNQDEDEIAYPFVREGWKNDADVSPQLYTFQDWEAHSFTPFYKNVEHDKIRLL